LFGIMGGGGGFFPGDIFAVAPAIEVLTFAGLGIHEEDVEIAALVLFRLFALGGLAGGWVVRWFGGLRAFGADALQLFVALL
jgi:hypothetical protein